jgi:hypothetical protein
VGQRLDGLGRQHLLGRHLQFAGLADGEHERAPVRLARDDDRAVVAALEQVGLAVEP